MTVESEFFVKFKKYLELAAPKFDLLFFFLILCPSNYYDVSSIACRRSLLL